MYVSSLPQDAEFDYIVVGAGSSGCVMADRLSADGRHRVLLIEAGGRDNKLNIRIPLMVAKLLMDERVTWPFKTEPQTHLNGKPQLWVRGRVIGGSNSINGLLFVRGDPMEYDKWRDAGCAGWGYSDMLPYFKQIEDYPEGDPAVRGRDGPIGVTDLGHFDELVDAFVGACEQNGFKRLSDYNDGSYEGTFPLQYSTKNGLRSSSAYAYLRPASKRPHLTILTDAVATRVLTEGRRATGIEVSCGGGLQRIRARREVVLSAGPLKSPQILELSGIGNADVLQKFGIDVVHHLPGVGANLRDHPNVRLTFECARPITINDVLRSPLLRVKEGLRFIFQRKGLLTICSATAQTNFRSSKDVRQPDLVLRLLPVSGKDRYARTKAYGLDPFPGFTFGITPLQPHSVGTLHIRSRNPHDQAAMDPRYLSHEADAQLILDGIRVARKVAQQPALNSLIVRETRPGPETVDNAALLDYVRETAQTSWHMVGTCKMGVDDMAVVDPQLGVRGIANLRVVDTSICPTIPSSNTNAPAIAIGEKGADMVLAAARA
ncbi:MAG: GMC family oxidoreductase N-terminal domain-containing protein [Betaproteobacteria bacterium]|nr:GMC family oxidoreductase N-terminal domain-containing protein [Betaproteobacteria bacterium]